MRELRGLQTSRRSLLAGLALATALAGCGSGSGKSGDAGAGDRKPGEKIEMTFWSWVPGVDTLLSAGGAVMPRRNAPDSQPERRGDQVMTPRPSFWQTGSSSHSMSRSSRL